MRHSAETIRTEELSIPQSATNEEDLGSSLSLGDVALMLGRHKWFIAICTLLGTLIAGVYIFFATPIYQATATMRIDPQRASSLGLSDLLAGGGTGESELLETEIAILKSDTVAIDTLDSLSDDEFQRYAKVPKRTINITPGATSLTPAQEYLLGSTEANVSANVVGGTQLVAVNFRNPNPAIAAMMVNHFVAAYLKQSFDSRSGTVEQVKQWLSGQQKALQDRAAEAQQKLAAFQEANDIIGSDPGSNTTLDRLRALNTRLTEAESERLVREAQMRTAATGDTAVLAAMLPDSNLQTLESQQAALYGQYAALSSKFGRNYPPLADLKQQMQKVDSELERAVATVHGRLKEQYDAAVASERLIQQQYTEQTEKAFALNRKQAEYAVLLAEGKASRELYDTLQYKLQQAGVDAGLAGVNTMVVDTARAPLDPVEPKKTLILSFGVVLGLFAGLSAAFLKEAIADSVQSAEQIERVLGYHLLAVVPHFTPSQAAIKETTASTEGIKLPMLRSASAPLSRDAEAYRALRNSILLSSLDHPYKSILITSALAGEGKSNTTSNYAVVLAQRGARVLVIDADLRRPRLHESFGLSNEAGLSNLILGEDIPPPFKQPLTDLPNLFVLTAGRKVPLPSEALSSTKLRAMIEQWEQEYDFVIVDSAPILVVSDTLPLASWLDALVLVARYNRTPLRSLRRLRDVLARARANVAGVVINDISGGGASYGGYGYGYGKYKDYYN